MKKKTVILISIILAAVLMLGACAGKADLTLPEEHDAADLPAIASPAPIPNNDAAIIVLEIDGREVTKDQYEQTFSALCQQYGVSEDDPVYGPMLRDSAIDLVLTEQIIGIKLEELGYLDLSEEDMQYAKDQAQAELDYMSMNANATILAGLPEDYTEEDLKAATTAYEDDLLAQYNLTREDYLNYFVETVALDNARAVLLADAVPIEAEVRMQYENAVEADKQQISDDLSVYESYYMQGQISYYIPEGIRMVRHVLISLDDELSVNIRTLRQDGDEEAANEAREEALVSIQEEADMVLKILQEDEATFTEAIEQFGDDPGMASNTDGYEVYENCGVWMPEFTEGAMSLTQVGEITGLVPTDYGYHIIEYSSDKPAGPIPFETVQQQIYDSLLQTVQDTAWQSLVEEWKSQIEYTIFEDAL